MFWVMKIKENIQFKKHVDLLLLTEKEKRHYVLMKLLKNLTCSNCSFRFLFKHFRFAS